MAEHGIPAVERAVEVLDALAERPGVTISDLAGALLIPRSTIYRILKSLQAMDIVIKDPAGAYELGPRLVRLARGVRSGADLVSIARPEMEALSQALDCTVKLSVLDQGAALVVAVAESPQTYSITTQVGRRFPLHAGAASKLLLAFAPEAVRREVLGGELTRYTPSTVTNPRVLARSLREAADRELAEDRGEFVSGVHAVARPVFDSDGNCVAALSIPFLAELAPKRVEVLRQDLATAAGKITKRIGGRPKAA